MRFVLFLLQIPRYRGCVAVLRRRQSDQGVSTARVFRFTTWLKFLKSKEPASTSRARNQYESRGRSWDVRGGEALIGDFTTGRGPESRTLSKKSCTSRKKCIGSIFLAAIPEDMHAKWLFVRTGVGRGYELHVSSNVRNVASLFRKTLFK